MRPPTGPDSASDRWVVAPQVPLSLPLNPAKRWLKVLIGNLLAKLLPARLDRLHREERYASLGAVDQWMLAATVHTAQQRGDDQLSSRVLQKFWQSQEAAHWMHGNARYRELFLPTHARIVAPLIGAVQQRNCTALIEIGCGRGDVLRHLAAAMPALQCLTGLDLNPTLLAEARRHTSDPRIRFEAGDARALIRSQLQPGTAVMTCGGVFEYWSVRHLLEDLRFIASVPDTVIALVEPISSTHDLVNEPASKPYGTEASLSHNYSALLRECGYEILYAENLFTGAQRWQLMVAVPLSSA